MPILNVTVGDNYVHITAEYENSLEGIPEYMILNDLLNVLKSIMEVNT